MEPKVTCEMCGKTNLELKVELLSLCAEEQRFPSAMEMATTGVEYFEDYELNLCYTCFARLDSVSIHG